MLLGRNFMDGHQLSYGPFASTIRTTISPLATSLSPAALSEQNSLVSSEQLLMQDTGPSAPSEPHMTILNSFEELGHWTTDTKITALIHALLASFSVILVSELGDKTFIITAIMAMKNSRSLVFISSASALLVMTTLSVGMGAAATIIPELYTHYASIVLFLCFGLKMLKESWDMKDNHVDESEFEEVKRSLEVEEDNVKSKPKEMNQASDSKTPREAQQIADKTEKWYSKLIETLYIAPIVIKVFTMIFVAEWGDRSQISTVILAAREDSVGVFVGSLSGHVFCSALAVIGGRFVADMISVRTSKSVIFFSRKLAKP